MIIRRDGDIVRLYSRKAIDWTTRLPAIKRAWDVVVDRLIEAAIVALLALAAGVPWVAGFCNWFGRVLH
jgi:ATP-dependent DNA ligase